MFGYIAQRLVGAVSVLFVVSVVSFGLYALTPGDPAVVLLEAAGIHSPPPDAVAAKRLAYRYVPCDPGMTVNADPERLQQVVLNLLTNAKHACEESGSISKRISIRVTQNENSVSVSVTDNGVGISAENGVHFRQSRLHGS